MKIQSMLSASCNGKKALPRQITFCSSWGNQYSHNPYGDWHGDSLPSYGQNNNRLLHEARLQEKSDAYYTWLKDGIEEIQASGKFAKNAPELLNEVPTTKTFKVTHRCKIEPLRTMEQLLKSIIRKMAA